MNVDKYDLKELLEKLERAYSDASSAESASDVDDANRYASSARSTLGDAREQLEDIIRYSD